MKSPRRGIKRAFFYINPKGTVDLIKAAEKAGVEYVVLLSADDLDVEVDGKVNPIMEQNFLAEDALRNSKLKWTFLRPVGFATNALNYWGWQIKNQRAVKVPYPNTHAAIVTEWDIAEVAVVALTTDSLIGKAPVLTGPESITQEQQLKTISEVIGEPIKVVKITREEAIAQWSVHLDLGRATTVADFYGKHDGKPAPVSGEVEKITGRKSQSFAEWAKANRAAFL